MGKLGATAVMAAVDNLSWLAPTLLLVGTVIVALIQGVAIIVRRRGDRREQLEDQKSLRSATESQDWDEVRSARAEATRYYTLYTAFRDRFDIVQSALRHMLRLIQATHPEMELPPDVTSASQLTGPDVPQQ